MAACTFLPIAGTPGSPWPELDPNQQFPISNTGFAAAFSDEGTVLVSQAMDTMSGLYRATLNAAGRLSAWERVFDIPATVLGLSPAGDTALAYGSGLWRSADGGNTWQQVGRGLTGIDNLAADQFLFSPDFARDQTVYLFFRGDSAASGVLFRSHRRRLELAAVANAGQRQTVHRHHRHPRR